MSQTARETGAGADLGICLGKGRQKKKNAKKSALK